MAKSPSIEPFAGCPASDGYHCITSSLAKIYRHAGHPLSEELLLGLGAGMGFIYWVSRGDSGTSVFVGGRGNGKRFFDDVGKRTGVAIRELRTASGKKAEAALLERLRSAEPVMLFGDMGFLPWFDFPEEYHFGGHSFVACGYDGADTVLASDMDPKAAGLKKGFYYPIPLERLRAARGSPYKPFPPGNARLEFDFSLWREPGPDDIYSSIRQAAEAQLGAPTKSFGLKGMRRAAAELPKWPAMFPEAELRANLFNLYVFIEIGGTGGGCFRYMYSRFLREAAAIAGRESLGGPASAIEEAGRSLSALAALFKDAFRATDLEGRTRKAGELFAAAADLEEGAFSALSRIVEKC
jgi:hypothetical protein